MVYIIYCRYEYLSKDGKKFSKYFKLDKLYKTEEEVKNRIKELKSFSDITDKIVKLKREYKYEYIDEVMLDQPHLSRPKGRPKNIDLEYIDEIVKKLKKSNKVKIDEEYGRYIYNDDKVKEYIKSKIKGDKTIRYWYDDNKQVYIFLKDKTNG